MKKPFASLALAAVAAVAFCILSPLASYAQTKSHSGGSHSTSDTYIVIQIRTKVQNGDRKSEYKKDYKEITTKSLKDEVKRAKDDFEQQKKEWRDAVKDGSKDPAPRPWTPKKVPGSPTFDTQKGAQDYIDKLKAEDEKKSGDNGDKKE